MVRRPGYGGADDKGGAVHRIVLECLGIPVGKGEAAAADIEQEFRKHRSHHRNVVCTFENGRLVLRAENDFDPNGLALMDEFSDCISACVATTFDGDLRFVSITII